MDSTLSYFMASALSVAARIGMLMTFGPFFGNQAVPARVKAGLTIALTVALYPVCAPPPSRMDEVAWGLVILRETMIGLTLGLSAQMVFEGAQFAGQVLGIQMGFSLVSVLDPQTSADTPILASFQQMVVLLIFLQLNVHHWILRGLVRSFAVVPRDSVHISAEAAHQMVKVAGTLFVVGAEIAAPILAATLLIDVALGLMGRVAPQVPVLFLGISVKSVVGLTILAGSLTIWPKLFERYFGDAMRVSNQLLGAFR